MAKQSVETGQVRKPRLLDLFCCEGGAGAGYQRAGWHVVGVDRERRFERRYPGVFYLGDALGFLRSHGYQFDAIHASPPCQWYTRGNAPRRGQESKWEQSIPPIREALEATGKPYIIENVKDAGWDLHDPVTLCGCMFDLSALDFSCTGGMDADHAEACDMIHGVRVHLQRPRLFETNWGMTAPRPCDHSEHEWVAGSYGGARRDKYEAKYVRKGGYVPPEKRVVKELLGVEHDMTWNGLFECVPPAYTEHIGRQLDVSLRPAVAGRHDPACSLRDTDEMPSERRCTCAADVVIRPDSLPSRAHEAKDCWCGQHHAREDFL